MATRPNTRNNTHMTSNRTGPGGVALAATSIIATLLGALVGAGVTFLVFRLQYDAGLAAEERSLRRDTYNEYMDAATAFLQAQLDLVQDDANCVAHQSSDVAGKTAKVCIAWDGTPLHDARDRWYNAGQGLKVYGSQEVLDIAEKIDSEIEPVDPFLMPYAPGLDVFTKMPHGPEEMIAQRSERDEALEPFNDAAAEFDQRMCIDTSVFPERCSSAFKD